jgi:metal-sulfur cluster biosynthetic enzyme
MMDQLQQVATTLLTSDDVRARLATVMDPELHVDIVSLGLIYNIEVVTIASQPPQPGQKPAQDGQIYQIFIRMTLTTPGCPLAGVFDQLVKESLVGLADVNPKRDVEVELTFDPPWVPDMMSEEARAELGFDT